MLKKENLKNKTSISPVIFTKKTNDNYKLIPCNVLINDVGKMKYLPPVSKEWKNSVYNYNHDYNINFPVYDLKINELIKGYFNLYFNSRFLKHKYLSRKSKRKSFNRIFVSKAEIKHTNDKAIVTLYVYNKEKISLLKKLRLLKIRYRKKLNISKSLIRFAILLKYSIKKIFVQCANLIEKSGLESSYLSLLLQYKRKNKTVGLRKIYLRRNLRFSKKIQKIFSKIRKLRLRLSLNKYKFEEKFLYKLSQLIGKYYGKKVEFNIVNLKSISRNSDIFTEILTLKMKKDRSNPMRRLNSLLAKVVLPKANTIIERGRIEKQVDFSFLDNKYKNNNISEIINKLSLAYNSSNIGVYAQSQKDNLNKLLYNLYYKTITDNKDINTKSSVTNLSWNQSYYKTLRNIIFENIQYKNMGGARLSVKGRLTRRYRADRAIYKLKWKGGLKNIDSSFKGLSTVVLRGYLDSNVEKSMLVSKRRIGSFAVKSWFSSK